MPRIFVNWLLVALMFGGVVLPDWLRHVRAAEEKLPAGTVARLTPPRIRAEARRATPGEFTFAARLDAGEPLPRAIPLDFRRPALPLPDLARPVPRRVFRPDSGPLAEFERQQALVVAWRRDCAEACQVQIRIARKASRHVSVIVVVPPEDDIESVRDEFKKVRALDNVLFVPLPVDTVWVRDYGPFLVRGEQGQVRLIDAAYGSLGRSADDQFPTAFAGQCGLLTAETGLCIEGGNLLTNGQGLLLTTTRTIADNQQLGYSMSETQTKLLNQWNAHELVILEPLAGEPTSHIDMFVTFVNDRTVVVASIDPKDDRFNARLLDKAAQRLSEVQTATGPLRVERIPMPRQWDSSKWPTYTNVVFANNVLLMPYYFEKDATWKTAAGTYARLLPGWKIVGIDCSDVIGLGGALHCLTLNIPHLPMITAQP